MRDHGGGPLLDHYLYDLNYEMPREIDHKTYDDARNRIEEDVWVELLEAVEAGEITQDEAEQKMFEWHNKYGTD